MLGCGETLTVITDILELPCSEEILGTNNSDKGEDRIYSRMTDTTDLHKTLQRGSSMHTRGPVRSATWSNANHTAEPACNGSLLITTERGGDSSYDYI